MNEWELDKARLNTLVAELSSSPELPGSSLDYEIAVAQEGARQYREWLASQYGPDPCVECTRMKVVDGGKCVQYKIGDEPLPSQTCGDKREYIGQQSGLAKGVAVGAWMVVEMMMDRARGMSYDLDWDEMALEMEKQLRLRGVEEPKDTFYNHAETVGYRNKVIAEAAHKREQEILEWLDWWPETASLCEVREYLREWLKGEGSG